LESTRIPTQGYGCECPRLRRLNARSDNLFESKPSPRTESLVAAAVQWAERIMRKIDNVFSG
jgi:hypothetical protein